MKPAGPPLDPSAPALAPLRELRSALERSERGEPIDASRALAQLARLESAFALLGQVSRSSFEEFENRVRDLSLLRRIGDLFASCHDMDRLCEQLLDVVSAEIPAHWIAVYVRAEHAPAPLLHRARDHGFPDSQKPLLREAATQAVRRRRDLWVADARKHSTLRALSDESVPCSLLCLPLLGRDDWLGALALADTRSDAFGIEQVRLLRAVASLASVAIRHAQLCESLVERQRELEDSVRDRSRALDEARTALGRREKMAALGKLAAAIAHEINNPMSYVLSNVNTARDELAQAVEDLDRRDRPERAQAHMKEVGDLLHDVAEGLERIRSVAYELRSFGREDARGERVASDLSRLAETAAEIARADARGQTQIELDAGTVPPVLCHRYQIIQVIVNLLINALEAEAGRIRVATSCDADRVRVEVSDDGAGVPESIRERIFEPFFTTRPERNSGLGLSISRDIAEAHEGTLSLRSGPGTTFVLDLPAQPDPGARPPAAGDPARD